MQTVLPFTARRYLSITANEPEVSPIYIRGSLAALFPRWSTFTTSRCLSRAQNIVEDHSHPGSHFFKLLPSGRRYRCIKSRTNRLKDSFFPRAILTLNTNWTLMCTDILLSTMCIYVYHISVQTPLLVQRLLYLYLYSVSEYSIIPVKYLHFLCHVFIFSFQIVLFRARSLPHISVIISLTSCDWLLLNYIYKQLCLC